VSTTEQNEQNTDGRKPPAVPDEGTTIRLRIDGTYLELDPLKLDGIEMRTVEQMTGLPYAEVAGYAERGSSTAILAFLYVGLARAGSTVGSPEEFLSEWTLERMEKIERIREDPTPAETAVGETSDPAIADVVSIGSGSMDLDAIGDRTSHASTESARGSASA